MGLIGPKIMIVLGIDPGSSIIGYGLIENKKGKLKCLDYGVVKIANPEVGPRLLEMKKEIDKLLNKSKPKLAVIEKIFFYKNAKTAIEVFEARGVIILSLSQKNIPFVEVTPLQLKKTLTGYGGAAKINIQKMLKLILNLEEEPRPDDAADALALAVIGAGK